MMDNCRLVVVNHWWMHSLSMMISSCQLTTNAYFLSMMIDTFLINGEWIVLLTNDERILAADK